MSSSVIFGLLEGSEKADEIDNIAFRGTALVGSPHQTHMPSPQPPCSPCSERQTTRSCRVAKGHAMGHASLRRFKSVTTLRDPRQATSGNLSLRHRSASLG